MARGGYRGGSSIIGWSSHGYRDSLMPKPQRKAEVATPAVRAQMARLDRQATKAEAARKKIIGEASPPLAPRTAKPKRELSPIKKVRLGGLTEGERAEIQSSGRMRRVIVEKKIIRRS